MHHEGGHEHDGEHCYCGSYGGGAMLWVGVAMMITALALAIGLATFAQSRPGTFEESDSQFIMERWGQVAWIALVAGGVLAAAGTANRWCGSACCDWDDHDDSKTMKVVESAKPRTRRGRA